MAPIEFLRNFKRKAGSYLRLYGWLLWDGAREMKLLVAAVVVLSFLGVMARASTYGAVLKFARCIETGKPARLGPIVVPVGTSLEVLLLWAGLVLGVGLLSALVVYIAQASALRAGHRFEVKASSRLLSLVSRSPTVAASGFGDLQPAALLSRLSRTDTRFMRRAYQLMLDSVIPFLQLVVWTGVLIYTDWLLTVVVGVIGVFYLFPFYLVQRQAAQHSRDYEAALYESSPSAVPSVLQRFIESESPPDAEERWKERVYGAGPTRRRLDAYRGRLLVRAKSDLLNDGFFGLFLAVILVVFGVAVLQGNRYWSDFATYLVALKLAQGSLKRLTAKVSSMSRFHPQISRYRRFLRRHAETPPAAATGREPDLPYILKAAGEGLGEIAEPVTVTAGSSLLCLAPQRPTRYTLAAVVLPLLDGAYDDPEERASSVALLGRAEGLLPGSLLYNLVGSDPGAEARGSAEDILSQLGVLESLTSLPEGLETDVSDPAVADLEADPWFAVVAMPCLLSGKPFLAIDWSALMRTSPEFRRRLFGLLEEQVLFLLATRAPDEPEDVELHGCAVVDEARLVASGGMDWYRRARPQLQQYLDARRKAEAAEEEEDLDLLLEDS